MYRTPEILRLSVHREARPEPAAPPDIRPDTPPPVAECLAFIRVCRDRLVPLVDRAAGVTPKELRLLRELRSERGDSAAKVARRLGIDDGEMSRMVKRLAARNLLGKTPAPGRHAFALRLTPTGRALVDRSNWAEHCLMEERLEELTTEEQRRLRDAVAVVMEMLGGGNEA